MNLSLVCSIISYIKEDIDLFVKSLENKEVIYYITVLFWKGKLEFLDQVHVGYGQEQEY